MQVNCDEIIFIHTLTDSPVRISLSDLRKTITRTALPDHLCEHTHEAHVLGKCGRSLPIARSISRAFQPKRQFRSYLAGDSKQSGLSSTMVLGRAISNTLKN